MQEYLLRAKLAFAQDLDQDQPTWPNKLPINIGTFELKSSPNADLYLGESGWGSYRDDRYPQWEYPVSLTYLEIRLRAEGAARLLALADDEFEAIESLLRLFQPGEVSVRRHDRVWRVEGEELKQLLFLDWLPIKPDPVAVYDRLPYPFDDDVLAQFIDFFNLYWAMLKNIDPQLKTAISRFNSSLDRRTLADRLIDLVVALEALFGDGEPGSISYKVAIRCACWLHSSGQQRLTTFKTVKNRYSDRSRFVHGGKGKHPSQQQVDELENIVRMSIVKVLDHIRLKGSCPHPISFDSLIMTGEICGDSTALGGR